MTDRSDDHTHWPGFEVAIEGEGLSLADIPVGQLAELLQAAAATVETIAQERGVKLPMPCLVDVRNGSAAYDLRIRDLSAQTVVTEIEQHIKNRGKGSSNAVQHALERLHSAGRKTGSVRFVAYSKDGTKSDRVLRVAPPIAPVPAPYGSSAEIYGRVVAVSAGATRMVVKLRLDDGGSQEFRADPEVAKQAARLFLKTIRADVDYEVNDGEETGGIIVALERWDSVEDSDIVAEFDAARDKLIAEGVALRASEWLHELEDDR